MDEFKHLSGNRRIAELVYRLVTEAQSPSRQAVAVGIGVFIGCIPLFGIHLPLVLLVATILNLSRLRMYAASWISNPFVAPFLVWSEFQVGSFLLTGKLMDHSLESVRVTGVWALGQALAVGAVVVGLALGLAVGLVVWRWIPRGEEETRRRRVIEETAHRYLDLGVGPWFRTRRLFYRNRALVEMVTSGRLDPKNGLTDLGCGRGEFLALLLCGTPHDFPRSCTGVAADSSSAAVARKILPSTVDIEVVDSDGWCLDSTDTIVVWSAKNRATPPVSDRLVKLVRASINQPGSVLIVWSDRDGMADAESVARLLESEGFEVKETSVSSRWFRRRNLILASA